MTAQFLPYPRFKALDESAGFLAGGKLHTYSAGTTTPKATYTDQSGTTPNENPITLDGSGEADVWLGSGSYKLVLMDEDDNVIWTEDNVESTANGSSGTVFADRYPDIQSAIDALPAAGGIVDATSPDVNLSLGTFDPGTKSITLLLGPYTYTFNQIVLQSNLRILGAAPEIGLTSSPGSVLQSVGSDLTPAVILGAQPTVGVVLRDFRLYGANATNGGTQAGLQIQAALAGGLWWAEFTNLYIANFGGIVIDFDGSIGSSSINQFNTLTDVRAFRNPYVATPNYALRLLGANGQFSFIDCQFDGQYNSIDAGENVRIEASNVAGFVLPYSILFEGMTNQFAAVGVHIIGAVGVKFHACHHEAEFGCYLLDFNPGVGVGSWGIGIDSCYFLNSAGVNSGAGYLAKIATAAKDDAGLSFTNNGTFNVPDNAVVGAQGAHVVLHDNYSLTGAIGPSSTGITPTIAPSTTINTFRARVVNLSNSATPIKNINSSISSGDTLTFVVVTGSAIFDNSGNVALGGSTTLTLSAGQSAMFVPCELTGKWHLVGNGGGVLA